jgi:hypothetical protein
MPVFLLTVAELIEAGAMKTVAWAYSSGATPARVLKQLRKRFGSLGEVTAKVSKELYDIYIESQRLADEIQTGIPVDQNLLPERSDLISNYRYTVIVSIVCPDGTHDSYPIFVDSDFEMSASEIKTIAASILDHLVASKYERMAKFDVNRRLGDPCHETVDITEAWRRTGHIQYAAGL